MSKILLSGKPRRETWKDLDKEMKSRKDKDRKLGINATFMHQHAL